VRAALRHTAFLDREIEQVERLVAKQMLTWPEAKRLMTVPGVNLIAAATFLAAVGDIACFRNSRKLVAYLGLDPRVRQSGEQRARCARSTCGPGRVAGMARRSSPPRASSRRCSGACSPATRTTPTSSRR
jgi:transposase